jgi:hypothetical protein
LCCAGHLSCNDYHTPGVNADSSSTPHVRQVVSVAHTQGRSSGVAAHAKRLPCTRSMPCSQSQPPFQPTRLYTTTNTVVLSPVGHHKPARHHKPVRVQVAPRRGRCLCTHTFTTQGGQRIPPGNLHKSPNTPRQVQHGLPMTADTHTAVRTLNTNRSSSQFGETTLATNTYIYPETGHGQTMKHSQAHSNPLQTIMCNKCVSPDLCSSAHDRSTRPTPLAAECAWPCQAHPTCAGKR